MALITLGRAVRLFCCGVIALCLLFAFLATDPAVIATELVIAAVSVLNLRFLAWDIT